MGWHRSKISQNHNSRGRNDAPQVSKNLYAKFRIAKNFRQKMTPSENLLWSGLRGNQLLGLHFRRQHVIHGFIVDFYCHRARLVIEIDGGIHRSQCETDARRDDILESLGLWVQHFSNEFLEINLEKVFRIIGDLCRQRIPDLNRKFLPRDSEYRLLS